MKSLPGQEAEMDWDAEKESYASLADEMNDEDAPAWNESDWDAQAVAEAKRYAEKNGLSWPPRKGDFDRFYEKQSS
jgi:hypothetical protein